RDRDEDGRLDLGIRSLSEESAEDLVGLERPRPAQRPEHAPPRLDRLRTFVELGELSRRIVEIEHRIESRLPDAPRKIELADAIDEERAVMVGEVADDGSPELRVLMTLACSIAK